MAYTASQDAFHFTVNGIKFHVDVWTDVQFPELDVQLRRLDPAANKWEYIISHVVPDNDIRGGFLVAVEIFNRKLGEIFPKADAALTPEQELRKLVREGLTFNSSTNELEMS